MIRVYDTIIINDEFYTEGQMIMLAQLPVDLDIPPGSGSW